MGGFQVIGYSYQDQFQALPSSPGVGWDVAWVRELSLVYVDMGVTLVLIFLAPILACLLWRVRSFVRIRLHLQFNVHLISNSSIFSYFPPAFTLRRYQRATLATTCAELGVIYCAVLSYASTHDVNSTGSGALGHSDESHAIAARLIAIRSKLKRLQAGRVNVKYEVSEVIFSSDV